MSLKSLRALAAGTVLPEDASNWARPWVAKRDDEIDDVVAIGPKEDGTLLFGPTDFNNWLVEYMEEIGGASDVLPNAERGDNW
jgi:hypothetical protein